MIAKIRVGSGFRGTLNYVAGKPDARLLGADGMVGRSPRELAREFGILRQLRPTLGKAVAHISVRLPPGETLSEDQWRGVAGRLLDRLDFAGAPFASYLHEDGDGVGHHLHVIASRVRFDGSVVSTSQNFRRAMEVLRELERDYGLRHVPSGPADRRPPSAYLEHAQPRPESPLPVLRSAIDRAVTSSADLPSFVTSLEEVGVAFLPHIASTSRVSGASFRLAGGLFVKGSSLGRAYGWAALLKRASWSYEPERDLPTLIAAREASLRQGDFFRPAESLAMALDDLPVARTSDRSDRTSEQVRAFLKALGSTHFDLKVFDSSTGETEIRARLEPEQLQTGLLPWLRQQNAAGREILIRPSPSGETVLLAGVNPPKVDEARARGYEPAVVVDSADRRREVWMRHPSGAFDEEHYRSLAGRFGVASPEVHGFGHLPGFTSRVDDRRPSPYVTLEEARALPYSRAAEDLHAVQARALVRTLAQEIESAAAATRDAGAALRQSLAGSLPPHSSLPSEAVSDLGSLHREAVTVRAEVHKMIEAVGPGVRTARDLDRGLEELLPSLGRSREIDHRLWEATGLGDPSSDLGTLERASSLHGRIGSLETAIDELASRRQVGGASQALHRSELSTSLESAYRDHERLATMVAKKRPPVEAIAAECQRLGRQFELAPSAGMAGEYFRAEVALRERVAGSEREATLAARAFDRGATRMGVAELHGILLSPADLRELAACEDRARLAERAALRDLLPLAQRDLERQARHVLEIPDRPSVQRFIEAVRTRDRVVGRLEGLESPVDRAVLLSAAAPSPADLRTIRKERLRAESNLERRPGSETIKALEQALGFERQIQSASELGEARSRLAGDSKVMRLAHQRLEPGASENRFVQLYERRAASEAELARLLSRTPAPAFQTETSRPGAAPTSARLEYFRGRVVVGDLTPETLARLRTTVELSLPAASLSPVAVQVPADLIDASRAERSARADLLRQVSRPSETFTDRLRLRTVVARYQEAASHLQSAIQRRQPATLDLRPFLQHPTFRGRPDRALLAWAHHLSARLGRDSARHRLLRHPQKSRHVTAMVLSPRFAVAAVATQVVRFVTRVVQRELRR